MPKISEFPKVLAQPNAVHDRVLLQTPVGFDVGGNPTSYYNVTVPVAALLGPTGPSGPSIAGPTGPSGMSITGPTGPSGAVPFSWNTLTGNYVIALTDAQNGVAINSLVAATITVPADSSVNFPIGTSILITSDSTGVVSIIAGIGVSISISSDLSLTLDRQYSMVTIVKRAANVWYAAGSFAAS